MTRALGIDIGASLIRVAEIESQGRSRRIVGLYELPRREGISPGDALREFLESSGITGERVSLGTGGLPVILRSFELPFNNKKKVEAAIRGEFEDTLPFEIEGHVLEIRPTGQRGKNYQFLAGLVPPDALKQLDTIADDSGILINSYFPDAEALGQLALNQNLPAARTGQVYAVIDLGYATTKVTFLRGARPKYLDRKAKETVTPEILEMRTINRGSKDLIAWIRDRNSLTQEESLQWLVHRAEIKTETTEAEPSIVDDVSDEIKTALRPVIVEIYQTFQSFKMKSGGESPGTAYLTGGISGLKGLKEFLALELRAQFHHWPTFEGFSSDSVPMTAEKGRSFTVALALAHRWTYAPKSGWLNFKRVMAQKKVLSSVIEQYSMPPLRYVALGLLASVGFMICYSFGSTWMLGRQSAKVEADLVGEFRRLNRDTVKLVETFHGNADKAEELFAREKKKQSREAEASGSTTPKTRARAEILLDVTDALPAGVTLRELKIHGAGATVAVESTLNFKEGITPEQLQAHREKMSAVLKPRGYGDPQMSVSPSDPKTITLKAQWQGAL